MSKFWKPKPGENVIRFLDPPPDSYVMHRFTPGKKTVVPAKLFKKMEAAQGTGCVLDDIFPAVEMVYLEVQKSPGGDYGILPLRVHQYWRVLMSTGHFDKLENAYAQGAD